MRYSSIAKASAVLTLAAGITLIGGTASFASCPVSAANSNAENSFCVQSGNDRVQSTSEFIRKQNEASQAFIEERKKALKDSMPVYEPIKIDPAPVAAIQDAAGAIVGQSILDTVAVGYVDAVNRGGVAGWCKDPDVSGTTSAHLYVNGQFRDAKPCVDARGDSVNGYGYNFATPLNPGDQVLVYAIGLLPDNTPSAP